MAVKKETEAPELSLSDVQAQVAAMLDKAREEAAKIVADAQAQAKGEMSASASQERRKQRDYMEELVEVKLFKDNGKYKDPVFVSVNGENCVIQRGERVKIKRKFAEVLDNSDRQDYETARLIERRSAEFDKMSKTIEN